MSSSDRHSPYHHGGGRVIWITGLSGSGKTTLCRALRALLRPRMPNLVLLDGDEIREAFGHDLGHSESDRTTQIGRVQRMARLLARQELVVLVAALYAHPTLLAWNRANLPGYFEIYLSADLDLLATRDSKGLYARARTGELSNLVGVDIPWHAPQHADLVIDVAAAPPAEILAVDIARALLGADNVLAAQSLRAET